MISNCLTLYVMLLNIKNKQKVMKMKSVFVWKEQKINSIFLSVKSQYLMSFWLFIHKKRQSWKWNSLSARRAWWPTLGQKSWQQYEQQQCLYRSATTDPRVKFTASQRHNTQLVLDDFVLKKKKRPNLRKVSFTLEI